MLKAYFDKVNVYDTGNFNSFMKAKQKRYLSSRTRPLPIKIVSLVSVLIFAVAQMAHGQMFSVDDSPGRFDRPNAAVFAGFEHIDFKYQGDENAFASNAYSFSGNVMRFRFESSGANVYLGLGGSATGLDDASYFDAGIRYGYGIGLYQSQDLSVLLPVVLHSSFTSVGNDDMVVVDAPQFEQGTFEFGGGLGVNARLAPQFRLALKVIPSYGFSFSTRERDASGSIGAIKGESRFYFDHLFGRAGLSVGYDYNTRWFDIQDEALDYNATAHSILIGITF